MAHRKTLAQVVEGAGKSRRPVRRARPRTPAPLPFSTPPRQTKRQWKTGEWAALSYKARHDLRFWDELLPQRVQIAQLDNGTRGPIARVVDPTHVKTGPAPGGGWWVLQSELEALS